MKKTVVLSILMAIILAASLSFSCFATESTNYYISANKDILCNTSGISLGYCNKLLAYNSTSYLLNYLVGVTADYVDATHKANVKFSLTAGVLNMDYYDAHDMYLAAGPTVQFDEYIVNVARTIGFDVITDTDNPAYTTGTYSHQSSIPSIAQGNLYCVAVTGSGYYKNIYNGSMRFDTVFCTINNYLDCHFYY